MPSAPPPSIEPKTLTSTILQGSAAPREEPKQEERKREAKQEERTRTDCAKTLVQGSAEVAPPKAELIETAEPKADLAAERKESREKPNGDKPHAKVLSTESEDEVSVPPATTNIDAESERFFSESAIAVEKQYTREVADEIEDLVPEHERRKLDPHVIRRREKFIGYVKMAVAGAAVVCLAAVGRSTMLHPSAPRPAAQPVPVAEPVATAAPPETKAAEPSVTAAPTQEPPPAETAATAPPVDSAAAAPAAPPAASAKPEEATGDAKEELKKSRTALERRKIADAIEAGERSVALDPTDGEAWLILGASYQEKGDLVNAQRCYLSCVKEGKTGPRGECQKMLR